MKRATIALTSFSVAALAVMGGFVYRNHRTAEFYRHQVVNTYRHAFSEVVAEVAVLDSALQKCVYSGSAEMETQAFMGVYGASMAARQALGELPQQDEGFAATAKFIATVGDYAFTLSKKTAGGELVTDEEMANLQQLSDAASVLSGNLTELMAELNGGTLTLAELNNVKARASRSGAEVANVNEVASGTFSERMSVAQNEFPEMPSLIYDGPFSSHIDGMKPLFLEGRDEISQDEAQKIAEEFVGLSGLEFDGERTGNLPVFIFSLPQYGGTSSVEVSKQGGEIVNFYSSHETGEHAITLGEAAEIARKFLDDHGIENLTETYRMSTGGTVTVNYAYEQDGVVCYTDLIKVEVARDTGDVTGYEAQGYVMHHHERELPEPSVSEEDARAKVSPRLKVLSAGLAVIPTDGRNEVFVREFKCEAEDGRHYIVYVNAETGREERVIILVESENGTLAM